MMADLDIKILIELFIIDKRLVVDLMPAMTAEEFFFPLFLKRT